MRDFCPFCKNPLTPWFQWKASDGRLYCNEFCADAGEMVAEAVDEFIPTTVRFQGRPSPRA